MNGLVGFLEEDINLLRIFLNFLCIVTACSLGYSDSAMLDQIIFERYSMYFNAFENQKVQIPRCRM